MHILGKNQRSGRLDNGSALTELAIVLPLLLLLGAGLINLGMLIWQILLVMEAGRSAGRLGIVYDQSAPFNPSSDGLRATCAEIETVTQISNQAMIGDAKVKAWQWDNPTVGYRCVTWNGHRYRFLVVEQQVKTNTSCVFCFGKIFNSIVPRFQQAYLTEQEACQDSAIGVGCS